MPCLWQVIVACVTLCKQRLLAGWCILLVMPNNPAPPVSPSPEQGGGHLVVAISSRALFDLDESHHIFIEQGEEAYSHYQIEHENDLLAPGVAFRMVRKLLAINARAGQPRVEVVLISRNSADTGLRVFNSIRHYGLDITRAAFTRGETPYRYIAPFGAHLFLSASPEDVRNALEAGIAAATILPSGGEDSGSEQLRIAFDGDAVIFSDEAERIFAADGLEAFYRNEFDAREIPLPPGPFQPFVAALQQIQSGFPAHEAPIRTALITARGAPAHERVIKTLRRWGIRTDEAIFLAGKDKSAFLKSFGADIFFDDQRRNCDLASGVVATGHVPYGVKNTA